MGKSNNRMLNELLVNLFHNVMDAEAKAVITDEFKDITNNDIHILEAIGIEEPKSMSRIAGELHVTVGTLTTNMNSLERKGYLTRNRSTRDKRVVLVTLTEKGRKAFFHHRDFHRKMIHTVMDHKHEQHADSHKKEYQTNDLLHLSNGSRLFSLYYMQSILNITCLL